jgi:hypothetical protein
MNLPINYYLTDWRQHREAREEYEKRQQGKCCADFCGLLLSSFPEAIKVKYPISAKDWQRFPTAEHFIDYPKHLHHNHDTGMTIRSI